VKYSALLAAALGLISSIGLAASAEISPEIDVHDPAMAQDSGSVYLYSTGPGIPFYVSNDLVHWSNGGRVFSSAPSWATAVAPAFNGHFWAPDVIRRGGKYLLYYSVSGFGKNNSAIGLAVNDSLDPAAPNYRWDDKGIVVQSEAGRDLWNAIDPNVIVDEHGVAWMTFGSFWSGIKLAKLNAEWTRPDEPGNWHTLARRDRSAFTDDKSAGPGAIEGPFLYRHDGYYYLFVSTGLCCKGKASTYRIEVGRSKDITGPYLDRDGRDMAKGGGSPLFPENKAWACWGGSGVYTIRGSDYVVMHAYEAADNDFHRLKIAKISWDAAGWPVADPKALDSYHALQSK
jgi:arabinan endo-1,5-alpha-L-arabinosidase